MTAFRRVVFTGVECSGKTTLSKRLAEDLGWAWVEEAARGHADVRANKIQESTFDELHEQQTQRAAASHRDGYNGVICDTGDLVLRIWAEQALGFSWHPLLPAWPPVDLHILCPTLSNWKPDPLRSLPEYKDRIALEEIYIQHLRHRPHLVVQGDTLEDRLVFLKNHWPW